MKRLTFWFTVLGIVACAVPARAEVRLPAILSEHAVLQRDVAVPIWGWADAGEEVTVTLAGQTRTAKPAADGRWEVRFDRLAAGGPHTLEVKGKNAITIKDVLVGEVWLGSGQSNMAMRVSGCNNAEAEKKTADIPRLRMFTEASSAAAKPQTLGSGKWLICTPDNVGAFSATLYFFGRELQRTLDVPVGLINSSVGGTPIESWIDVAAQRQVPELKPMLEAQAKTAAAFDPVKAKAAYEKQLAAWEEAAKKAKAAGQPAPVKPRDPIASRALKGDVGDLFNGKIAPLIPYALRGAVWYQGEANSSPDKAPLYRHQLTLLIKDWRARWGQGDFPFAWVQLPNFDGPGRDWPIVREAMLQTLSVPNTGMAITIDIGDAKDIHPKNKQDVGRRLSLWALATVYGRKDIASSGPLYSGHEIKGNEVALSFRHADGGLTVRGGMLKGFEVAGTDGKWLAAEARLVGDKVIVSNVDVKQPSAVRYAWANNPVATLYNGAGLPASPFRTDAK